MEIYSSLGLMSNMRIGFGKDIHILKENIDLIIGGVKIPSSLGSYSYSDGDALTHAIIDSLLGALALKDIGEHFKDSDIKNHNRSSLEMLKITKEMIDKQNYKISNIDTYICLEQPKLKEYKSLIQQKLSETLNIEPSRISIKAGTNEGIGEVGNSKAIECYAICLLEEKNG